MRRVLVVLGLLGLGVWLWRGGVATDPATEAKLAAAPRYQLQGLAVLRTDEKGTPLVRLTAKKGDYYDGGAARLETIEAEGLSGNSAPWQLLSPLGTVAAGEKRLLLHTPVTGQGRWTNGETFTFKGEDVWVDDARRRLYSERPMQLLSPSRTARAKGFTASFDGKTLQMTQPDLSYDLGN